MPDTMMTDSRHFVDERGTLARMPGPALRLACFLRAIVGWVSRFGGTLERTNVPCRRTPRHRPCTGEIIAGLGNSPDQIVWQCPECGDNGVIHGWRGSRWDRSR